MIVVAGEALIDLLVHPDGRLTAVPGGGPFNTARTIARLGGRGRVPRAACRRDRFGRTSAGGTRRTTASTCRWPATTDAPTTLAIAELDDDGRGDLPVPHRRDLGAAARDARRVEAALRDAGRGRSTSGTLGLVLDPMASALATGRRRARRRARW